jgi:alginate O-acetyltransferase complex protein AlgF
MKRILTLGILALGTGLVIAQGLYAPEPPANSSFVRIINAGLNASAVGVKRDGKTWISALTAQGILPYEVVRAGKHSFELVGSVANVVLDAQAGKFYTLAILGKSAEISFKTFNDKKITNKVKAQILAYNFSKTSLSVKTTDGTAVFKALQPNASQDVMVNPVNITLNTFAGDTKNSSFKMRLQSAQSYTIVAFDLGGTTKVVQVNSTTAPYQK